MLTSAMNPTRVATFKVFRFQGPQEGISNIQTMAGPFLFISGMAQRGCMQAALASTTEPPKLLRQSANRDSNTWLWHKKKMSWKSIQKILVIKKPCLL